MSRLEERWDQNKDLLVEAARKAGIDPAIMAKISGFESGFDPGARPISRNENLNRVRQFDGVMAISSAHGYGQFLNGTWHDMLTRYGEKHGVPGAAGLTQEQSNALEFRQDKRLQAAMLAEFTKENITKGAKLGGADANANVYAFHNLGDRDATRFLTALLEHPDRRADQVLSDRVIGGNPALYGNGNRTLAESYRAMGAAMAKYESFAQQATSLDNREPGVVQELEQELQRILGYPSVANSPADYSRQSAEFSPARDHPTDGQLRLGAKGTRVTQLQRELTALGMTDGEGHALTVDGAFGNRTREAVENFQLWNGLATTGIADKQTLAVLRSSVRESGNIKARDGQGALPVHEAGPNPPSFPSDASHPDHPLLEKLRSSVRNLDRQTGKDWDEHSERLSASALALAKERGFSAQDDLQLVFNRATEKTASGEIVHLVRRGPGISADPAANRAHMTTADALSVPAEVRFLQVESIEQARMAQISRQPDPAQTRGPDDLSHVGPVLRI